MLPQITYTMAQAAGPNWMTLGIIFGIMVLIALVLLILPNGVDHSEIESDKKKPKELEDKTAKKSLPAADQSDKEKMSLAEIKEAKRASVSEDKSKEERRELRKERRAATQTANAIHEREATENSADEKKEIKAEAPRTEEKKSEVVVTENKAEEKKSAETAAETAKESATETATEKVVSNEEKAKSSEDKGNAADILAVDEIIAKADNDTGDVFASLFGEVGESELSFDDITDVPKPENGSVFPTLGSALIPLNDLPHDDDDGFDALSELTKRFENKSEKKTPQ